MQQPAAHASCRTWSTKPVLGVRNGRPASPSDLPMLGLGLRVANGCDDLTAGGGTRAMRRLMQFLAIPASNSKCAAIASAPCLPQQERSWQLTSSQERSPLLKRVFRRLPAARLLAAVLMALAWFLCACVTTLPPARVAASSLVSMSVSMLSVDDSASCRRSQYV